MTPDITPEARMVIDAFVNGIVLGMFVGAGLFEFLERKMLRKNEGGG